MPSWPGLLARLGLRIGHLRRHLSVGRRTMRRTSLSVLMLLALASAARAQAPEDSTRDLTAIKSDLARTKADLEAVKGQLAQVLRLLSQRAAQGGAAPSGPVRASVANAPSLGRAEAPVTLVEFSDFQCPFCQSAAPTLKEVEQKFGDKVRIVYRQFPLTN